jgi:hypothetical protein
VSVDAGLGIMHAHFESWKTLMWYTRTDDNSDFSKVNLLILFSTVPYLQGEIPLLHLELDQYLRGVNILAPYMEYLELLYVGT